ncbi:hypothetical protein GCM10007301_38710 [Azorhizobium oxalatiphilum]|uniref:Uncharacterized protein n=1 Tax=Azorhizobium oxalatiphilum TaxID=980631 RepID=A0A917C825_9HYPH|nr:hypothetical protein [Azorhizobium oxalatiphilum]GGF75079.1 hypothetical protein GCM10007301_38710 [Azorhizobium oxalatiphilum]
MRGTRGFGGRPHTGGWHPIARRLALLLLALLVAMGVTPAAMACAPSGVAGSQAAGVATHHAHGMDAAATAAAPHPAASHAAASHAPASHGPVSHGHEGPAACGHLSCPACLARLPGAPEAPSVATRAQLMLHGLALLPAGITPAPPRAPPRAA